MRWDFENITVHSKPALCICFISSCFISSLWLLDGHLTSSSLSIITHQWLHMASLPPLALSHAEFSLALNTSILWPFSVPWKDLCTCFKIYTWLGKFTLSYRKSSPFSLKHFLDNQMKLKENDALLDHVSMCPSFHCIFSNSKRTRDRPGYSPCLAHLVQ